MNLPRQWTTKIAGCLILQYFRLILPIPRVKACLILHSKKNTALVEA